MSKQQVVDIYKHRISFNNEIGSVALDTDDGNFGLSIYFNDANLVTKLRLYAVPVAQVDFHGYPGQRLVQNYTESPSVCDSVFSKLKEKLFNKYGKPTNELTYDDSNQGLIINTIEYSYNFPDNSNIKLKKDYIVYAMSGHFFNCGTDITLFLSSNKESKDDYQFK